MELCFSTPRMIMQRWRDSIRTPTPPRVGGFQDRMGNLFGQAFLNLKAARVHIDQPGDLAQAEYPAVRNVPDMTAPEKREHMMFAQAVDLDIPHDDHAFGLLFETGVIDERVRIGPKARGQENQRFRNPEGGAEQAFAVGIFSELDQQLTNQVLEFFRVRLPVVHS